MTKFCVGFAVCFLMVLASGAAAHALTSSSPALAPDYEAVTLIRTDGHDPETGGTLPGYCNATLLDPSLLITAAHCLSDAYFMKSNAIRVEVGRYKYVTKPDGQVVRIGYAPFLQLETKGSFNFSQALARRILSQGFRVTIAPEEDLAVIVLATPLTLPADFIFARTASQQEFAAVQGSPLAASPKVVTLNPFEEVTSMDTKRVAALNSVTWSGFFRSTSGSRVQPGDSGAPLFARTSSGDRLVGVVKGEGHTFFSSWDAYAPAGPLACDVANQLRDPAMRALLCHR